jgi:hypothetical protein
MRNMVLRPIEQSGYWRVEMMWPGNSPRYFGWFASQSDAESWIEEHRWLTTQNHEQRKGARNVLARVAVIAPGSA